MSDKHPCRIATEGRRLRAVAHLALARSQKTKVGISGVIQVNWAALAALFLYKVHDVGGKILFDIDIMKIKKEP